MNKTTVNLPPHNCAVFGTKEKCLKTALFGVHYWGFDILHIYLKKKENENTLLFTYIQVVQPITIVICLFTAQFSIYVLFGMMYVHLGMIYVIWIE